MKKQKILKLIPLKLSMLILLIILLSFLSITLQGQVIERQFIGVTGNTSSTSNLQVSSSVGELLINTEKNGTIILTQGFQQPLVEEFVSTFEINDIEVEMSVFPNPTLSTLNVKMLSSKSIDLLIFVKDLTGIDILPPKKIFFTGENLEVLNLNNTASGNYILLLSDLNGQVIKSFKIIKLK